MHIVVVTTRFLCCWISSPPVGLWLTVSAAAPSRSLQSTSRLRELSAAVVGQIWKFCSVVCFLWELLSSTFLY